MRNGRLLYVAIKTRPEDTLQASLSVLPLATGGALTAGLRLAVLAPSSPNLLPPLLGGAIRTAVALSMITVRTDAPELAASGAVELTVARAQAFSSSVDNRPSEEDTEASAASSEAVVRSPGRSVQDCPGFGLFVGAGPSRSAGTRPRQDHSIAQSARQHPARPAATASGRTRGRKARRHPLG